MRRIGVFLAIAGLLAQAGLLMLHRPPSAAPPSERVAQLDAARLDAARLVSALPGHRHAAAPHAPDPGAPSPALPHCPICLALHLIGGFVPPPAAEIAPPAFSMVPAPRIVAEPAASARWIAALPQPRGPPGEA